MGELLQKSSIQDLVERVSRKGVLENNETCETIMFRATRYVVGLCEDILVVESKYSCGAGIEL
jgi:hypothetical protein